MSTELQKLISLARGIRMTGEEQEEQRRSFAYGNTGFENPRITREMIDAQAESLKAADRNE